MGADKLLTAKRNKSYSHPPAFLDYLARKNPGELLRLVREYSSGLSGYDSHTRKTFMDLMRAVDAANSKGIELPSSVAAALPRQVVIGLVNLQGVMPHSHFPSIPIDASYAIRVLGGSNPPFNADAVKEAIAEGYSHLEADIREGGNIRTWIAYAHGKSLTLLAHELGIAFGSSEPAVQNLEGFKAALSGKYKSGDGRRLARSLSLPLER